MMETHIEDGKMTCLYELVDGAAGSSHASSIAQLLQISVDETLPNRRVSAFISYSLYIKWSLYKVPNSIYIKSS